ncbi:non-specific lipid-transfer protein 1-like [Juglans microcarpa x Juglans regia]|uniref:non-specific lipid-transfer protein 1-like n=1 Tax=Juglans microcarpa x Juglans regia TaxID=2249226 RepID=UPI001B7DFF34|nr:non-specific lipid-transfer protein 1-like [Juglans microcarpa x Juglans regia]
MAALKMACTAVLVCVMLVVAAHVDATLTCREITNLLSPCVGYVIFGGTVPTICCDGIKALNAASNGKADDRAACRCIKKGLSGISGINYDLVGTLPETCGTTCPYKITPTTDCSKVD